MRKATVVFSIAVSVLLCGQAVFASVNDDQVTSQKIKEADGTSGQNTNSGSGVKTGHIQDSAVTTGKIADNAVSTGKIADGAVTDAKIGGQISASKISSTGLNADTVDGQHASAFALASHVHSMASVSGLEVSLAGKADVTHNHDALYQQKYGKVAVVAQTGGDYADPVSALNSIATWCGTPSPTNHCLMKVLPGAYDIGAVSLQMVDYVDLEGSGENVTIITGSAPGATTGAIVGASNMEMRFFTVKNVTAAGVDTMNNAIYNSNASPKIFKVTAICSGGQYCSGVRNDLSSSPIMTEVTAIATIDAANAYGAYGIFNAGGAAPSMTDVKALGSSGGRYSAGIINSGANPTLTNVEATGSGIPGMFGSLSVGIWNQGCSSPVILMNVRATATGGSGENNGIYNYMSSATLVNVVSTASGPNSKGLLTASQGTVSIDHSVIQGSSASIKNSGAAVFAGNSKLDGVLVNTSGETRCVGSYDGNYLPVACQ